MINLEIAGVRYQLDDKVKKYTLKKLGRLDKYLPRRARRPAHGRVILSEEDGKSKNRFTCEATLTIPNGVVTAAESTINIYAAIDIVEEKVKAQLLKYKDKSVNRRRLVRTRRMLKQFRFGRFRDGDDLE